MTGLHLKIRKTPRAHWWDYAFASAYFITICTQNREYLFGQIIKNKMNLSPAGEWAKRCWCEIPNHAKNVELGAYVVMPDHIHGILILHSTDSNIADVMKGLTREEKDAMHDNERTTHALSLQPYFAGKRFRNLGKNTVSSIIGGYKSAVSKHANREGIEMNWQSRFHDHIIRDNEEFQRIENYIKSNIINWGLKRKSRM